MFSRQTLCIVVLIHRSGLCVVNWWLYDVVRMKFDDIEQERARCDRGILVVDEGGKVVVRVRQKVEEWIIRLVSQSKAKDNIGSNSSLAGISNILHKAICITNIVFSNKTNDKPCPKTNRNRQE
ncbi:unnamed protein product [Vicia faba]|uniref:Uncharacterized protein n=1 Tax=Vicia faba TaxID=3906 RepID=A0AAV0YHW2_VICFA|nr:unnamed protein product [Vicia faba]